MISEKRREEGIKAHGPYKQLLGKEEEGERDLAAITEIIRKRRRLAFRVPQKLIN